MFSLTVNNGTRDSAPVTVTVTVNTPPVADGGELPAFSPGDTVTLDGSGSTDADGHALTYRWTQVSGTTVTLSSATAVSPTFTAPQLPPGQTQFNLVFSLTVNDGYVDSKPDTTTDDSSNTKPMAEAGR